MRARERVIIIIYIIIIIIGFFGFGWVFLGFGNNRSVFRKTIRFIWVFLGFGIIRFLCRSAALFAVGPVALTPLLILGVVLVHPFLDEREAHGKCTTFWKIRNFACLLVVHQSKHQLTDLLWWQHRQMLSIFGIKDKAPFISHVAHTSLIRIPYL